MGAPKVNLYNLQELFSRTMIPVKFGVSISFSNLLNWMDFRLSNNCKKQLGKKKNLSYYKTLQFNET